ncbi:MAG: integrase family protein [Planctomycetota bacterium]
MPNARLKLTKSAVEKLCLPPEEGETNSNGKPINALTYWDTELKGFGLGVYRSGRRTWFVQKDIRGKTRQVTIGQYPAWTPDMARKQAMELIVEMDSGVDPNARSREERARETTLDEAIEWHVTAMKAKRCAERSMATIREEGERHLADWLKRPLSSITRNECAQRHQRITERAGPYATNRALQHFRAVYNTATRRLEELPPNPTIAITFNKTRRRREPVAWAALTDWKRRVDAIANPIRRDLQLFLVLTGLRSTDARTVRWEHVDFEAGTLHRPKPKGGEDRAFTVPVSTPVLNLLRRRHDENPLIYPDDKGWVFPSTDIKGQVTYVRQPRESRYDERGMKVKYLPTPHRLRDTFASAAHEARVHPLDLKVLMNHSLPAGDDVTEGYIRPSIEHLRGCVEQIAEFLKSRMCDGR